MAEETVERAVKDLLPEETIEEIDERGIEYGPVLHLYHELGRDRDKFRRLISDFLEKTEPIEKSIELHKNEIETLKRIRKGILQKYGEKLEKEVT